MRGWRLFRAATPERAGRAAGGVFQLTMRMSPVSGAAGGEPGVDIGDGDLILSDAGDGIGGEVGDVHGAGAISRAGEAGCAADEELGMGAASGEIELGGAGFEAGQAGEGADLQGRRRRPSW